MHRKQTQIGIFGGTFNPVHCGHLKAADRVRKIFSLSEVIFIPSFIPPHKESSGIASPQHRLKMVELAAAPFPGFFPSAMEIKAGGRSYSIDTLETMKSIYSEAKIFFLLGIDAFLEIETWKDYESVLDQCSFIVMSRPGFDLEDASGVLNEKHLPRIRRVSKNEPHAGPQPQEDLIYLVSIDSMDISSSEIRKRVKMDRPIEGLVPASVEHYIKEKGLYR